MDHKALVFLSCGQREKESRLAKKIEEAVRRLGLKCYNADTRQGFDDVMSIVEHLSEADYYLFIDFKRQTARGKNKIPISVFAHQEFALARAWGMTELLAFREKGLPKWSCGMASYALVHPIEFKRRALVRLVTARIRKKLESGEWRKDYSRHLVASGIESAGPFPYDDHHGTNLEKIWCVTIKNQRNDLAAHNATAILDRIERISDQMPLPHDRTFLKWAEQEAYQRTIFPGDSARVDAFAVRVNQEGVFLHSASDVYPRRPIIRSPGTYRLTYVVYAEQFPPTRFTVRLKYSKPRRLNAASGEAWLPLIEATFETHPSKRRRPPIHPGEILLENYLTWKGVNQNRLARDIHVPARRINEIVHGTRAIDPDTALRLSRYFALPDEFWLYLQAKYDLEVEKDRLKDRLEREVLIHAPAQ